MKQDVNFNAFCDSFGESHKDNFSYEGKKALYDYLINYEEETETELELDTVAYCGDFSEYENLKELKGEYDSIKDMKDLEENTTVILIPDSDRFIIQQF